MNTTLRALINQAERLVRTGVYEEAIALCHAILRRYPRYARCYRILGEAYLGLAEYEEAARLFRRALGVDPEDPVAYTGLGIIFEERGLLEEAIWQLERAFELAPGRDELRRELGRLYEHRGSAAYVQLTRAGLARLYARGGLWNKAIGELHDLLVREPYRLDLRVTLARTLWRARRRDEAAEVAQTILDQAPNCLVARLILGTYRCQDGREDEGRALLDGAQELDPENREAARLLARESPLRLRVAHVETAPAEVLPAGMQGEEGEEVQGALPQPEAPAVEGLPEGPPAESWPEVGDEPAAVEEHIVALPPESLQALLLGRAAPAPPSSDGDELLPEEGEEPAEAGAGPRPPVSAPGSKAAGEVAGQRERDEETATPEPADEELPPLLSPVAVLRRRLDADPNDLEARADLAWALARRGELAEALTLYDSLATPTSGYLDRVLAELEALAGEHAQHRGLRELMGDVYARAGRFQEAMEMYRWVLAQSDTDRRAGG